MLQMKPILQKKKTSHLEAFLIYKSKLVRVTGL